jgi:hypothetical protein
MRSMIVLVVLGVTACGQMSGSTPGEDSMALAQTTTSTWQGKDGKALSVAQVQEAYRACQDRMFGPSRSLAAMTMPFDEEHTRLALSDPELDVCMQSFGYSQVGSPTGAKRPVG